ncbi:hypothetical protein, partial [Rhizobium ecuadorense]|uniref:hypothetical protein n=1 Tax=Rhizobium ecuadorense TaxID=1671795 RepID=UPI000A731A2B
VFTQLPHDYAPSKLWVNAVRLKAEVLRFDARTNAELEKLAEAMVGKAPVEFGSCMADCWERSARRGRYPT